MTDIVTHSFRETRLAEACVALTAVDVGEEELPHRLAEQCLAHLPVDAAAVLVERDGALQVAAATDGHLARLEELAVTHGEGPGPDAFRSGRSAVLTVPELQARWPRYADAAERPSWSFVHAIPLRAGIDTLGALVLTGRTRGLGIHDEVVAGSLADIAGAMLQRERAGREAEQLAVQLQHALDSRVLIEQAKGVIAERTKRSPGDAFELLRTYARAHRLRLRDVAQAIIDDDPAVLGRLPGSGRSTARH